MITRTALLRYLKKNNFKDDHTIAPELASYCHFSCYSREFGDSIHFICTIDNTLASPVVGQNLVELKERLESASLLRGLRDIHILFLVYSDYIERDRDINSVDVDFWLVDTIVKRLICYENTPEDFFGMRKFIEAAIVDDLHSTEFFHGKYPIITLSLAFINILIFILAEIFGNTEDSYYMMRLGAADSTLIYENHEYYRLLFCMFLHFGFDHIFNNMLSLVLIGNELEQQIGHFRFFFIYILSGLGSSIISSAIYYSHGSNVISAGASGAIMGIAGALIIALITSKKRNERYGEINRSRGIRFLIVIVLMIYSSLGNTGIDNYAHIGGLICGALLMLILQAVQKKH